MKQIWKSQWHKVNHQSETPESSGVAVATYRCESWTIKKRDEQRIEAFEMKYIQRILKVSWTQKKANEWVLETAGMERGLLNIIKRRKLLEMYRGQFYTGYRVIRRFFAESGYRIPSSGLSM